MNAAKNQFAFTRKASTTGAEANISYHYHNSIPSGKTLLAATLAFSIILGGCSPKDSESVHETPTAHNTPTTPSEVDVSGSWTGTTPGPSASNPTVIVDDGYTKTYRFQQDGERLTGTLTGISQHMAALGMSSPSLVLEDGKVQGHTIFFAWHTLNVNFDLRWTSEGTIDGDTITLVDKMNGATPPEAMAQPYRIRRVR